MVLLCGCRVDATVSVAVEADGSGSINVVVVADSQLVGRAPGLADDLRFADARAAGWSLTGPQATPDGGLRVDLVHGFTDVAQATALLASINGPAGPLHGMTLVRVGGGSPAISITGVLRVDGGLDAFTDPELLATLGAAPYAAEIAADGASIGDVASVTLRVALPGSVSAGSGARRGGAVEWVAPLDGSALDVAASARAGGGSGIWGVIADAALFILVIWLIVGVVLVVVVMRARRRRVMRRAGVHRG